MLAAFRYVNKRFSIAAHKTITIPDDFIPQKGMTVKFDDMEITFTAKKVELYIQVESGGTVATIELSLKSSYGKNSDQVIISLSTCKWTFAGYGD